MTTAGTVSPRSASDDVLGWSAIGVIAVGGIAVGAQRGLGIGPTNCLLRTAVGRPCPVCGLSGLVVRLLHGDVLGAVRADPVGLAFLAVLGAIAVWQLVRLARRNRPASSPRRVPAVAVGGLLGALLGAHWIATLSGAVTLPPLR